jgi:hypothetical protein
VIVTVALVASGWKQSAHTVAGLAASERLNKFFAPSHPFAGGDGGCRGGDDGMASPIFVPTSVAPTNSGHLAKGSRQHHKRIVVIEAA